MQEGDVSMSKKKVVLFLLTALAFCGMALARIDPMDQVGPDDGGPDYNAMDLICNAKGEGCTPPR